MERGTLIPLFPLNTVLFPNAVLPLHIFEDRYRQMVHRCIEQDESFGIILIQSGDEVEGAVEPFEIGTLAQITRLQHLEDGRMNLLALGSHRFRVRQLLREAPFLEAIVDPWDEYETRSTASSHDLAEQVAEAFKTYLSRLLDSHGLDMTRIELPQNPVTLSFAVAATLQTTLPFKQYLLELQDTSERLRLLLQILLEYAQLPHTQSLDPDRWTSYLSRN
jgi:Lon protease-like protein